MAKLYVGNLPSETNEEDLKIFFAEFAQGIRVTVIRDKFTNQSRGFAFVEMDDPAQASKAIAELNGRNLRGRVLKINEDEDIVPHFKTPVHRQSIELEFISLARKWKRETLLLSSLTEIAMHPAYQRIIGMGHAVVPYILNELEKESGHWFWALIYTTGVDPVSAEDKGNINRMRQTWLEWGRAQGHLART